MFLGKNNIRNLLTVASFSGLILFSSCEEPENENKSNNKSLTNTLNSQSVGDGSSGLIEDYFYNFDDAIDASFFRYGKSRFNTSYDKYITLYPYPPDNLNMKNFPDYLLDVTPDSAQFVVRHPIDTLVIGMDTITSDIGTIVEDSLQLSSSQFKNLEAIEWDLDAEPSLQRYRLRNSSWVQKDTMIYYADTFDVKAYWAVLDTPLIESGFMFVDTSEWRDTSYSFIKDELLSFTSNFEFTRTQMHSDSLIFRINTDCNDNNQWDQGEVGVSDYNSDGDMKDILYEVNENFDYNGNGVLEDVVYEFTDRGNDLLDPAETYYDINENGTFDLNEPYEDRNCNDRWDDAEAEDVGNGRYDDIELFTLKDLDGDGAYEKHLYMTGSVPNNILVDWSDSSNPQLLLNISIGDDLTDRWGNVYNDIIETVSFVDTKRKEIGDVDSLITLYTHDMVGYINDETQVPSDYYVTKTEFISNRSGDDGLRLDYDYQIFSKNKHVSQLVYKNYFLPPGFYWSEYQVDQGFWHKNQLEKEIYLYSYNGLIRDGEHVDTAYYDTTEIAIYLVEKTFEVERSEIIVPAARVSSVYNNGSYTCLRDNSIVSSSDDCPQADTTFADCFKVTQVTNMTMMGSGVEYGQKVYTWLAKDHGIVKSDMYIRWTENPYSESFGVGEVDASGQVWAGYSRIELSKLDIEKSGNVFRQIYSPAHIINMNEIGNLPDFDFDPMKVSNQTGFHTIRIGEDQE
ncbi:MAG: hypothetical protein CMG41_01150 [Candidatus Marinimicrobia bacterium]|nr:hypothetical protein [Candidatus Neomarinimicrobiota bacterium]